MEPFEIFAQAVGIVAMVIGVLSFQQKTQKGIVTMQFCSSILFAVHFGLLQAWMGCILNGIGIIRAAVYSQRSKHAWAAHAAWMFGFIAAFVCTYILSFAVFATPPTLPNFIKEILPVIGMVATTVSFRAKSAALVRSLSFVSSPAWLAYNIWSGSLGGALTECFVVVSIIVGILRLDRKKGSDGQGAAQDE